MKTYDELLKAILKEGAIIFDGKEYVPNPLLEELRNHPERANRVAEGNRLATKSRKI